MSGAILTSGEWFAVAAMRCLGKHGIKVACGESRAHPVTFYSRYCNRHFFYPPFQTQPENFIDAVCDFANQYKEFDVLMPIAGETYTISKYLDYIKSRSPQLKIPLQQYEYINFANDKQKISELATKMGIPIPQTFTPRSIEEVKTIADRISYPSVIKIRSGTGGSGMTYIHSSQNMVHLYEETVNKFSLDINNLPIIQEYIPGTDYGAAALFNHGHLRAKIVFKALRSIPPSGGLMISRVSVLNEQMLDYIVALACEMHWHGVIMADFRLDERDNTPKLLELNPRFWFSLYQAIAAGVEFPYLLYRMAVDNDVYSVENYKIGVRTGFTYSEALGLIVSLQETGNKLKAIKELMKFNTIKYEDVCINDPLPSVIIAWQLAIRFSKIRKWLNRNK